MQTSLGHLLVQERAPLYDPRIGYDEFHHYNIIILPKRVTTSNAIPKLSSLERGPVQTSAYNPASMS